MKTIYMKPELTVVNINKPCLLAGSEGIPVATENFSEGDVVLSKGGWNWSDEPEMDYEQSAH